MNENSIRELSSLSDEKLRLLTEEIAAALGADGKKLKNLSPSRLRGVLSTISDEEAARLIDRAGKEKAEEIYRAIRRSSANGR